MPRSGRNTPSFPGRLVFFLLAVGAGFFLGVHRDKVADLYATYSPPVRAGLETQVKRLKQKIQPLTPSVPQSGARPAAPLPSAARQPLPSPTESATSSADGQDIRVCSFNIRIFSNNSRDDAELTDIAQVLKYCDITAIQELRDERVLKRTQAILRQMGHNYDYQISAAVGRGVKERYAFLYRADRLSVVTPGRTVPDAADEFIREPYYAQFRAGNFDFILLTIHLLYGSSAQERRPELLSLARAFDQVRAENPTEQDIILLGDFNFPPDDAGWTALKQSPTMTYLIRPPEKTTITDTSLYDNIWFQASYVREYTGQAGIIKFDEDMFANDDRRASRTVSDHRPVWARFRIDQADDDYQVADGPAATPQPSAQAPAKRRSLSFHGSREKQTT